MTSLKNKLPKVAATAMMKQISLFLEAKIKTTPFPSYKEKNNYDFQNFMVKRAAVVSEARGMVRLSPTKKS